MIQALSTADGVGGTLTGRVARARRPPRSGPAGRRTPGQPCRWPCWHDVAVAIQTCLPSVSRESTVRPSTSTVVPVLAAVDGAHRRAAVDVADLRVGEADADHLVGPGRRACATPGLVRRREGRPGRPGGAVVVGPDDRGALPLGAGRATRGRTGACRPRWSSTPCRSCSAPAAAPSSTGLPEALDG